MDRTLDGGWYLRPGEAIGPDDDRAPATAASGPPRLAPVRVSWQGQLASTNLCVDSFGSSLVTAHRATPMHAAADLLFLLTHMHADHTAGLTPSWDLGTIYTSRTSKALLHAKFGIEDRHVVALPMHRPQRLPLNRAETEHVWVTLIDASTHCPGACMILLEGYFGRILYTGDIRFDQRCETNLLRLARRYATLKATEEKRAAGAPLKRVTHTRRRARADGATESKQSNGLTWLLEGEEQDSESEETSGQSDVELDDTEVSADDVLPRGGGILGFIDALYLDNTFCHPRYAHFHSTSTVLPAIKSIVDAHPDCDVLLGGDTLGKEDLLVLLSHLVESKIVVPESRWKLLQTMAQHGVVLNTEVDDELVQQITQGIKHATIGAPSSEVASSSAAAAASASSSNVAGVSSYVSPLASPRDWLSCFSPHPFDGCIKLGPKKQVTASNIEWMNRMALAQHVRHQRHERSQHRTRKRRKVPSPDQDEQLADDADLAQQPGDTAMEKDEQHSASDASSSESSEDDESGPGAGGLDRPVVGIIVSGWAVDRISHCLGAAATPTSAASLPTNAATLCRGPGPGGCKIHCLPYSSHSSYSELRRFLSLVRPNVIRPLCKGDCNTAVLDDLLCHDAVLRPIVIPTSMTLAALKPIDNLVHSVAQQRRVEQRARALTQSILQSSSSFASLASSIHLATSTSGKATLKGAGPRVAMPIGDGDDDESPVPLARARPSADCVVLDDEPVDLTNSWPASLPPLEDSDGFKYERTAIPKLPRDSTSSEDCVLVSAKISPLSTTSLPRVRTWLDLFAVFEHYPHVPIEGFVAPAPSLQHLQSYAYTRQHVAQVPPRQAPVAVAGAMVRKLPRFLLAPQQHPDPCSCWNCRVIGHVKADCPQLPRPAQAGGHSASVERCDQPANHDRPEADETMTERASTVLSATARSLAGRKVVDLARLPSPPSVKSKTEASTRPASRPIAPLVPSSSRALSATPPSLPSPLSAAPPRKRKKRAPLSLPPYMLESPRSVTLDSSRPRHLPPEVHDLTASPAKHAPTRAPRSILQFDCSYALSLLSD